jgi:hypothetical protein
VSDAARLRRPSGGMAPPTTATLPDGTPLDLIPLARVIADEHLARHPEEVERYGDAVRAWCVHDNQHLLNWAALDLAGAVDFDAQLRWLASVLTSRGYPLESVADDLRIAASVLRRPPSSDARRALADRLAAGAATVGGRAA